MYEIKFDERGSKATIFFDGSLKIQNAGDVKETLLSALTKADKIIINHDNGTAFDLTYLQLLIAAHKSASMQKKEISLSGKHPVEFYTLLRDSECPDYEWLNVEGKSAVETGEHDG